MTAIESLREYERRVKALQNCELPLQDKCILELAKEIENLKESIESIRDNPLGIEQ